jgi:hypothetical protein
LVVLCIADDACLLTGVRYVSETTALIVVQRGGAFVCTTLRDSE